MSDLTSGIMDNAGFKADILPSPNSVTGNKHNKNGVSGSDSKARRSNKVQRSYNSLKTMLQATSPTQRKLFEATKV